MGVGDRFSDALIQDQVAKRQKADAISEFMANKSKKAFGKSSSMVGADIDDAAIRDISASNLEGNEKLMAEMQARAEQDAIMSAPKDLADAYAKGNPQAISVIKGMAEPKRKAYFEQAVAEDFANRKASNDLNLAAQQKNYAYGLEHGVNLAGTNVFETPEQVAARKARKSYTLTPDQAKYLMETEGKVTPETADFYRRNEGAAYGGDYASMRADAKTDKERALVDDLEARAKTQWMGLPSDPTTFQKYLGAGAAIPSGAIGGATEALRARAEAQPGSAGAQPRFAGIPLGSAVKAAAEHPVDTLTEMLTGAAAGAKRRFSEGEMSTAGIGGSLIKTLDTYRAQAKPAVDAEMERRKAEFKTPQEADAARAEIEKNATEALMAAQDPKLMGVLTKNPKLAEDLLGIPLDAYWLVSPAKIVKGAKTVAEATGLAGKIGETAEAVGKAAPEVVKNAAKSLQYYPEAGELEKAASKLNPETAKGLASELRGAEAARIHDAPGVGTAEAFKSLSERNLAQRVAAGDVEAIESIRAARSAETGVEQAVVPAKIRKEMAAVLGDDAAAQSYIMPKSQLDFLTKRGKELGQSEAQNSKAMAVAQSFWNEVYTPINDAFRVNSTVNNPAYHLNNILSVPQYHFVGMGTKMFDPNAQRVGLTLAKEALFGSNPEALGKVFTSSKTGAKISLGEIKDLAQRRGLLSQGSEKIGGAVKEGSLLNPLRAAARGSEWVAEHGPLQLNQATDAYQKMVPFAHKLISEGDFSHKGVSAALDYASDIAGNYDRLGDAFKGVGKVYNFMSWTNFALRNNLMAAANKPGVYATFQKANQAYSDQDYVDSDRARMLGRAMDARGKMSYVSRENVQKLLGDDEKAIMMSRFEQPYNTLLDFMGTPRDSIASSSGNAAIQAAMIGLLGVDPSTGKPVDGLLPKLREIGLKAVPRVGQTAINAIKLATKNEDWDSAADIIWSLRANAELPGIARGIKAARGQKQLPVMGPTEKVSRTKPDLRGQVVDTVDAIKRREADKSWGKALGVDLGDL